MNLPLKIETPPNDFNVEQSVIGALVIEKNAFDEVSGILTAKSFYYEEFQILYSIIADLHRRNHPVDYSIMCFEVLKLPPEKVDLNTLTECTNKVAAATHIKYHASIIADLAAKRDIINLAHTVINEAPKMETDELQAMLRGHLDHADEIEADAGNAPVSLKEYLPTALALLNSTDHSKGLTTGFPVLDGHLSGLKPGRVYIMAGRPGQGKTSIALHTAIENAKEGKNTLFISAEQDVPDLANKIIGSTSGIGHQRLDRGNLSSNDWNILNTLDIPDYTGNIWLMANPKSVQQIVAIVRQQKKRNGLDLVIVDYLQLIPSESKKNTRMREQEVSEISRTLKQLSIAEKLPIIALSQLNRDGIGVPKLHHLRESGAIEQDADAVLLIYRPSMDGNLEFGDDYGEIHLAKNRRGIAGVAIKFYNQDMARFSDEPFDRPF